MYINRIAEKTVEKIGESFQCVAIYGPRQSGKSTMVWHLFGDKFEYVTLDEFKELKTAKEDPAMFLEQHPWPLIIDEIQRAPGLMSQIKIEIDRERLRCLDTGDDRQLMYVITGSNRFELEQGITESLAGRTGIIYLNSLTQTEKDGIEAVEFRPFVEDLKERAPKSPAKYRSQDALFDQIFQGGMPDIVLGNIDRDTFFSDYIDTYMEKDVKKLISVGHELLFRNFLEIMALRTSQEVKYSQWASECNVDVKTLRRWMSILEASGLIFILAPFYGIGAKKNLIKAPKMYFLDTGLCAYLCGWPDARMIQKSAMSGAFFETYVVSEIIKTDNAFGDSAHYRWHFYRDGNNREIDLIYSDATGVYPIEIKKSAAPAHATRGYRALEQSGMDIHTGIVIDTEKYMRKLAEDIYTYPVHLIGT